MLHLIRDKAQSLGTKIIFGIIILVFIFWGVGNFSSGGSDTVASVNGENISLRLVAEQVQQQLRMNPELSQRLRDDTEAQKQFKLMVLNSIISSELLKQEGERLGLVVTPQELRVDIGSMSYFQGENGQFDPDRYLSVLAAQKISVSEFEEERSNALLRSKLMGYMLAGVSVSEAETRTVFNFEREERKADYLLFSVSDHTSSITISDADIEKYYETNKELFKEEAKINLDYLLLTPESLAAAYAVSDDEVQTFYEENAAAFTEPLQYNIRQIVVYTPENGDEKANAEAKQRLQDALDRIKNGEAFASVASAVSDDKESGEQGGAIGWFAQNELLPAITAQLSTLKAGEVTSIIDLPGRYVIFQIDERKEERIKPLAEVKDAIAKRLSMDKARADYKAIEEKAENALREGTSLETLAAQFKTSVDSTGLIPLTEVERKIGLTQSPIDTLRVVGVGKTVPTPLSVVEGITLIHVKESIPEGIPPLDSLKATIAETLKQEKALQQAKDDAGKVLASIKNNNGTVPAEFANRIKTTDRTLRASPNGKLEIRPLGNVPPLVNDLFAANKGDWLPSVYTVEGGVAIAQLSYINANFEEEWNAYKNLYADGILGERLRLAEMAYMQQLLTNAKVTESIELLDRIPLN